MISLPTPSFEPNKEILISQSHLCSDLGLAQCSNPVLDPWTHNISFRLSPNLIFKSTSTFKPKKLQEPLTWIDLESLCSPLQSPRQHVQSTFCHAPWTIIGLDYSDKIDTPSLHIISPNRCARSWIFPALSCLDILQPWSLSQPFLWSILLQILIMIY